MPGTAPAKTAFEAAVCRTSYACSVIGALILAFILLVIAVGVVTRYAFDRPIVWADQVATYGLVYITFLGAPQVLARRKHVAVDILETALGRGGQQLLAVLVDIVGVVYCALFAVLATQEFRRVIARGAEFSDAFTVAQWVVYIAIPVGVVLLTLQFLANLIEDWRAWRAGPGDATGATSH